MLTESYPYQDWPEGFVDIVVQTLPNDRDVYEWSRRFGQPLTPYGDEVSLNYGPLLDCDYRLFFVVVLKCVQTWTSEFGVDSEDFVQGFNRLLDAYSVPWILNGQWIIPAIDAMYAEELRYVQSSCKPTDKRGEPHWLLKDALDALYRKDGGPDLASAILHAWGAWQAAAGVASGCGPKKGKAMRWVEDKLPELKKTMDAWKDLAQDGRHIEHGPVPSEQQTTFIVMLCVGAVRLLDEHGAEPA